MKLQDLEYVDLKTIDQELRDLLGLIENEMNLQGSTPLWLPYFLRVRIRRAMKYLRANIEPNQANEGSR